MKKQVIFIHGGSSFSKYEDYLESLKTNTLRDLPGSVVVDRRWKTGLALDLGGEYEVFMPAMPNAQNARYSEWKIWFERYLELVQEEVILIGWSLGGMFLAKYLSEEKVEVKISQLYLLAAPSGEYVGEGEDCRSFLFSGEEVSRFSDNKVENIQIWHSEDDFVVDVSEVDWFRKYLPQAEFKIFTDKNHFLGPELPELALQIKKFSN